MNTPRGVQLFVVMLICLTILHFSLTAIYNFNYLPWPEKIKSISARYASPLFHQNWKMFAPDVPAYQAELEFRYLSAEKWSDWQDVSASHDFGAHSYVEAMEQNINARLAYQIANNFYVRDARKVFDDIVRSFDYNKAVYFTEKLFEQRKGILPGDSLQLRVKFRFTPALDQADTQQISYLEFPIEKTIR